MRVTSTLITRVLPFVTVSAVGLVLLGGSVATPDADALSQHVTIRRDTFGVPHILADSEEAAAFALGYAQAEDHAVALGQRFLRARGEGARVFGREAMESDFAMRRFDNLGEATRQLARVGAPFRRVMAAFASGINQYVDQHRAELPEWMPRIDAADVLAQTRAGAAQSAVSASLLEDLKKKYEPAAASPTVSEAVEEGDGSNAFALAGSRTASGHPMLLGNPHLRWSSLYWEAHITVPGRINFYGSTLVGFPTLRAGFNDRLGYVQTNNDPDLDDVYALSVDPKDERRYLFNGRSRALERREVTVQVRQDDGSLRTESREFWWSHLGTVIYRHASKVFVVKSESLDAWRYFEGFQDLMRVRSLAEFQKTLARNLIPTSNFTYADAAGNIAYQWNARLPRRVEDGTSYELDVPGEPKYLWRGLHALADLPRLVNPSGGYVQNANNSPWYTSLTNPLDPAKFPSYVERRPLALRPQMALQMMRDHAKEKVSVDDVRAMKFNTHVLLADRVLPDLIAAGREAAHASEDLRRGLDVLQQWDRRVSAESAGAVLFMRFWDTYRAAVPEPYATPWTPSQPAATPTGLADRQTAVTLLAQAVAWTRQRYGSEAVRWGDVHRYRFGNLDLPADGADGNYGLFRVQRFDDQPDGRTRVAGIVAADKPLAGFGDGWVLLVHFTRPVEAHAVLAYGQTTRAESPHSRDQIRLFADHRLRRVVFTEAEIAANLERSYRP